ncbi:MAG: hypothetical protein PHQ53_03730 [Candidatus Krumholzibacteria bacterium]|nr:hypothetical protein [Candidatus Krumholzibacteria bacterium]
MAQAMMRNSNMPAKNRWNRLYQTVYKGIVALEAGPIDPPLRQLMKSQHASQEELLAIRSSRLQALIDHARHHVSRYRGYPPVLRPEDLNALPFVEKAHIQNRPEEFISRIAGRRLIKKTTGGSTGEPVTIWKDRQAWLWELAATWRGYSWAGIAIGDAQARFWGVPFRERDQRRAQLIDRICHRHRLSAFGFDAEAIDRYIEELRRFQPAYFYGYVSMISEFADHLVRHDLDWRPPLQCIITTSEVLTEPVRLKLEDVFQTRVYNEYGCGELGTIAHECDAGSMHVSAENMIVEIVDGERVCAAGEPGEVVVSELNNRAMPLVRYRLGDFATLSTATCPCGCTLPVLSGIHGRSYDMVRNRRGERFHGELLMYIFEEIKRKGGGLRQFQVIQESLDSFRIRVVPDGEYGPATEALIRKRLREHFGADSEIHFDIVECIEREPSGKMRLVIGLEKKNAEI